MIADGLKGNPAQAVKPVNKMSMEVLRLELIRGISNSNNVGAQEADLDSQQLADELKYRFK